MKADTETLKLVELFVNAPTSELPPEKVPDFLAVDPKTLPAKLRMSWMQKRQELLALKKIADGQKKPPIRRIDVPPPSERDCLPLEGEMADAILRSAGFNDVEEHEVMFLMEQTKCTECELMVEFTLEKALKHVKGKKGQVTTRTYYFLHPKDPLWTLVGAYRAGNKNPFGTPFFGIGHPRCH
ncbi:MAG: hypothetical protein HY922_12875 [Elusimicrobia bacterium]|nr:hypothetical protein [Elusimicrobiota bacterium]